MFMCMHCAFSCACTVHVHVHVLCMYLVIRATGGIRLAATSPSCVQRPAAAARAVLGAAARSERVLRGVVRIEEVEVRLGQDVAVVESGARSSRRRCMYAHRVSPGGPRGTQAAFDIRRLSRAGTCQCWPRWPPLAAPLGILSPLGHAWRCVQALRAACARSVPTDLMLSWRRNDKVALWSRVLCSD